VISVSTVDVGLRKKNSCDLFLTLALSDTFFRQYREDNVTVLGQT